MDHILRSELNKLSHINDEDWKTFLSIVEPKEFNKGEILLREGQICKGTSFIVTGAFRTFHQKDGNEIHTAFYFEKDFIRDIESLTEATPSKVNIVALEDSKTLYIPKSKMLELYEQIPSFQNLGRKLLELMVISERKYAALFTDHQPKERYLYVISQYPELVQRVPNQYLASFLGVARETLSRIRKRI